MRRYAGACLVLAFLCGSSRAALAALAPPFDVAAVRAAAGKPDKRPFTCDQPPAPMKDLHFESFYDKEDHTSSTVNAEAYATYKKAYKPASAFEIGLGATANRYVRANPPRPEIAACGLSWLAAWAEGDALLGEVNKNGEYTRKWLLGSIASDWLQIRGDKSLDAVKRREVEAWIRKVAEIVKSDFSRDEDLASRRNNHLYWAAWGVAAAAMALDDPSLFDWAMDKAREGINQIQPDGTLPLEVARGRKAYLYHLFAAMPLFMLAEAGARNGVDLFSENGGALKRLGDLNLANLSSPDDFEKITNEKQDLTRVGTPSDLGWVEIYRKRYEDHRADAVLARFRPMKQSRFGGNITLLYAKLDVKAPAGKKQPE